MLLVISIDYAFEDKATGFRQKERLETLGSFETLPEAKRFLRGVEKREPPNPLRVWTAGRAYEVRRNGGVVRRVFVADERFLENAPIASPPLKGPKGAKGKTAKQSRSE